MTDNTIAERQWLGVFEYILSVCIETSLFILRNHDYRNNNGKSRMVNLQYNSFIQNLWYSRVICAKRRFNEVGK